MTSSKSPMNKGICEASQDLISNMPDIVTDKILKRLSISEAAKMSTLSRKWRRNWLSHRYLYFDESFWLRYSEDGNCKWQKCSNIISSIFFHHNGPIKKFLLVFPETASKNLNVSQWLSYLSKTSVQKITLVKSCKFWSELECLPSYIFLCRTLVKLRLQSIALNPLPVDFEGFAHLRNLELNYIGLKKHVLLPNLIRKCPGLVFLKINNCAGCSGMTDLSVELAIDAPNLEKFILIGPAVAMQSLCFKNAPRLIDVYLRLTNPRDNHQSTGFGDTINSLCRSSNLQNLHVGGHFCELLAAEGVLKSVPEKFNSLVTLCLTDLKLSDPNVFYFTIGMFQSCPSIKDLEISVISSSNTDQPSLKYSNDTFKLPSLVKIKVTGITGSSAELKLIELLLAMSVVLENLFIICGKLDADSELKMSRELMRFPRASSKAQLICLEK